MKILISPGYGAGWSTWNSPELAYDPDVIEFFESGCNKEELREFCKEKGYVDSYGEGPYMGGFGNLKVVEVETDRVFRINEYDGYESIEFLNLSKWMVAN
jgi:hypothetical protein